MSGLKNVKRDARGRIPQLWTIDSAVNESKKYEDLKDFRTDSNSAYQYLVRKKSIGLANLNGKRHRVTDWEIFCSLKKSKDWTDFRINFPKDYITFSKRKGKIDKRAYEHLGVPKTAKRWTKETIEAEARKYKIRGDFWKKSSGAYSAASDLGILKDVCRHMQSKTSDYNCIYMWTADEKSDLRLVKIGVTSLRLGHTRIEFVERKSGFPASDLLIAECEDALFIESEAKKIGCPAVLPLFSGSSEFFWVDRCQYEKIERIIKDEATKHRVV
jgi:hypothetical protein